MKTQTALFIIGTILVIGLAVYFMKTPDEKVIENTTVTEVENTESGVDNMTSLEVATHNSQSDCYTIVGDKVYDVTSWISQHPGGEKAILGLCGIDATEQFTKQHGSNENAQAALKSFFIANLTI